MSAHPFSAEADVAHSSVRPGILLVLGRIADREKFGQYVAQLPDVYRQYGGRYLALAPAPLVQLSGSASIDFVPVSVVVSVWPSLARIRQFWESVEYQKVAALRAGTGEFMVAALEAVDETRFAIQLAKPQIDLALLLNPSGAVKSLNLDQHIAYGDILRLEGQFPGETVWFGWNENSPVSEAALRFVFPKLST